MIILGIIVIEAISVFDTILIFFNTAIDSVLEVSENGYKFSKESLIEWKKQIDKSNMENSNLKNKILGTILLFTPILNMTNAYIVKKKTISSIMKDPAIKNSLIPMSNEEKEKYSSLRNKVEKIEYIRTISLGQNENLDKLFKFNNLSENLKKEKIILNYDKLIPLSYKLDEVKKLNSITNGSYCLGKMNDMNVAIIGIPDSIKTIKKVVLNFKNDTTENDFIQTYDEDNLNNSFIIYSYLNISFDDIIEEIRQNRKHNNNSEFKTNKEFIDKINKYNLLKSNITNNKDEHIKQKTIKR